MNRGSSSEVDAQSAWHDRATLLRAMAHPVRLLILDTLCGGPRCVNDINTLVAIPQPHLSQHIAALRKAKLIACHVNGPLRCYYISRPTLVKELIRLLGREHAVTERDRDQVIEEANCNSCR